MAATDGVAAALVALVRRCHARGWVLATSGNFSVRTGADRFLITASGFDKGELGEGDLGTVWLDGRQEFPAGRRASAETPLHAALYARDHEIGAIAHTHSRAATILSRQVGVGTLELLGWEMQKGVAGVASHEQRVALPVVANDQDTTRLAAAADARLGDDTPGYLIAGHGLYTWGADIAAAARHVEALEFLLDCELATRGGSVR